MKSGMRRPTIESMRLRLLWTIQATMPLSSTARNIQTKASVKNLLES